MDEAPAYRSGSICRKTELLSCRRSKNGLHNNKCGRRSGQPIQAACLMVYCENQSLVFEKAFENPYEKESCDSRDAGSAGAGLPRVSNSSEAFRKKSVSEMLLI